MVIKILIGFVIWVIVADAYIGYIWAATKNDNAHEQKAIEK